MPFCERFLATDRSDRTIAVHTAVDAIGLRANRNSVGRDRPLQKSRDLKLEKFNKKRSATALSSARRAAARTAVLKILRSCGFRGFAS